jgi:uncharacterized protein (TIGR03000 family)
MQRFAGYLTVMAVSALWCCGANACFVRMCGHRPPTCVCSTAGSAAIEVRIPDGAKLYFGEIGTGQTSGTWTYWTPPLLVGWDYKYTLKVETQSGGSARTDTREVIVRACSTTPVDFEASTTPGETQAWQPKSPEEAKLGPPVQQASQPADVPDTINL